MVNNRLQFLQLKVWMILGGIILSNSYGSGNESCIDMTMVKYLMNRVQRSSGNITSGITNWYNYIYDGNASSISDGGFDMYDGGNQVYFRNSSSSSQTLANYNQLYINKNYQFFTSTTYPFTALMWINNTIGYTRYELRVHGDTGADGNGSYTTNSGSGTINGFYYRFRAYQIYGTTDPTICELFFFLSSRQIWKSVSASFYLQSFSRDTDDLETTVVLRGTPQRVLMGYMLLSNYPSRAFSTSELYQTLQNMLRNFYFGNPDKMIRSNLCEPTYGPMVVNLFNNIDYNSVSITAGIANWFNYIYDGYYYIYDGGFDMYDSGNRISFRNSSSSFEISARYNQLYLYETYQFYARTIYPFTALMWINRTVGSTTYYLRVNGNAGADGEGNYTTNNGTGSINGFVYSFHAYQIYGAVNPTICELYFFISSLQHWSSVSGIFSLRSFSRNTDYPNTTVTLNGSPQRVLLGYMLLSRYPTSSFSNAELNKVIRKMLEKLDTISLGNISMEVIGNTSEGFATVETLMNKVDSVFNDITSGIRRWYSYRYDSEDFILDGGSDMFDRGNYLFFQNSSSAGPTQAGYNDLYLFDTYEFYTRASHPFTALMWIKSTTGNTRYSIRVISQSGANGIGNYTTVNGNGTAYGYSYNFFSFQIYRTGDAGICQFFFYIQSIEHWNSIPGVIGFETFGSNVDYAKTTLTLSGAPERVLLGYMLLSSFRLRRNYLSSYVLHDVFTTILRRFSFVPFEITAREAMYRISLASENITNQVPMWLNYSYDGYSQNIRYNSGSNILDIENHVSIQRNNDPFVNVVYKRLYTYDEFDFYTETIYPFTALGRIVNENDSSLNIKLQIDGKFGGENQQTTYGNSFFSSNEANIHYHYFQSYNSRASRMNSRHAICRLLFAINSDELWSSNPRSWVTMRSYRMSSGFYRSTIALSGRPQNMFFGYLLLSKSGSRLTTTEMRNALTEVVTALIQLLSDINYNTSIECGNNMTIRTSQSYIRSMELYKEGDLLVISQNPLFSSNNLPEQCTALPSRPIFKFGINDCSPIVHINNDSLIYSYTVRPLRSRQESIRRTIIDSAFNLSCVIPINYLAQSRLLPEITFNTLEDVLENWNVSINMKLYNDENFQNQLQYGTPIVVPDFVYVQISLNHSARQMLVVEINQCWATRTSNESDQNNYPIIRDSCVVENYFDPVGSIEVMENYAGPTAKFKFRAFVWNGVDLSDQTIYVHCSFKLCDRANQSQSCKTLNCNDRRQKRNVDNDRVLLAGPIRIITADQSSCLLNNGGCSDVCIDESGEVKCYCPSGTKLDQDEKTCIATESQDMDDINLTIFYVVGGLVIAVVLLIALYVLYKIRTKTNNKN